MTDAIDDHDDRGLKERIEADDNPDATYYVPPNSGIRVVHVDEGDE